MPPGHDQPVLIGIQFSLTPGQVLAVVGPSAAGKSSLVKLLLGLWKPAKGSVRLDGVDLRDLTTAELRRHIAEAFDFFVQVWTQDGLRVFQSGTDAALPQRAVLGFSNIEVDGKPYRVYSMQSRTQVVQVAQDMRPRQTMARALAWRTVLPRRPGAQAAE